MFDLGRTLLAVVERSPDTLAIVDGERRLSYAAWYCEIGRVAGGLAALGLSRRDRLALILQNRLEMATLHWACQLVGIVVTPLNWRIKAEELDYCLRDADAGAIVFDEAAAAAVGGAVAARRLPRIAIGGAEGGTCRFEELAGAASCVAPQAGPEDLSLLLYTSGTTGRPKGVPRRQRAERAAALAHVENLYCRASVRSVSCRSTTRWVCVHCWRWRSSTARSSASIRNRRRLARRPAWRSQGAAVSHHRARHRQAHAHSAAASACAMIGRREAAAGIETLRCLRCKRRKV